MKTVTIPDPQEVGKMLDAELGAATGSHYVSFSNIGFSATHWLKSNDWVSATGDTPEALLAEIRRLLAERDPLAKLRKQAEEAGFKLVANESSDGAAGCGPNSP